MNALFPPPDIPTIRLRVLSLGAGVQSTTLALMAAHGEIGPMPDCAIFADTGWEPKAVYEHLAWLRSPNVLPFPVHIVTAGNIRDRLIRTGFRNLRGEVYLHRSCVPLDEADLDTPADKGQLDLFADECDGMCGV